MLSTIAIPSPISYQHFQLLLPLEHAVLFVIVASFGRTE